MPEKEILIVDGTCMPTGQVGGTPNDITATEIAVVGTPMVVEVAP